MSHHLGDWSQRGDPDAVYQKAFVHAFTSRDDRCRMITTDLHVPGKRLNVFFIRLSEKYRQDESYGRSSDDCRFLNYGASRCTCKPGIKDGEWHGVQNH